MTYTCECKPFCSYGDNGSSGGVGVGSALVAVDAALLSLFFLLCLNLRVSGSVLFMFL